MAHPTVHGIDTMWYPGNGMAGPAARPDVARSGAPEDRGAERDGRGAGLPRSAGARGPPGTETLAPRLYLAPSGDSLSPLQVPRGAPMTFRVLLSSACALALAACAGDQTAREPAVAANDGTPAPTVTKNVP